MSRFFISFISVMLTVSVIAALVVISTGIRDKIGGQLSAYGANIIVTPSRSEVIHYDVVKAISSISDRLRTLNTHIYGSIYIRGNAVDVIGLDIPQIKGFKINGNMPRNEEEILLGKNLAEILKAKEGDILNVEGSDERLIVKGIFERGSDEDSTIIMDIKKAGKILGIDGVSAVLLNVDPSAIDEVRGGINKMFPMLKVKTVLQIAEAEMNLLTKIELLMMLFTLVVLFSSSVTLGSTMGANVIERMEEVGLMKAIGAKKADIRNMFFGEAMIEGITGSIAGAFTGIMVAEVVSFSTFRSYVPVRFLYLFPVISVGVLLSVLATYIPVRFATRTSPSVILRGE